MRKHEEKYCPICNSLFECKVGDVINCQCNAIQLTDADRNFLSKTTFDCVCINCLKKIQHNVALANGNTFPTKKEDFVEGLHYYIENSNWVFTEYYHLLRGYCCKSGCRHCVYGFKKIQHEY